MINIAEKMRELLPLLERGINDVELPDIKPECEAEWSESYAIVQDFYWDEQGHYFDEAQFIHDVQKFLVAAFSGDGETVIPYWGNSGGTDASHTPGTILVRVYPQSQEIEVYRITGERDD